MLGILPLYGKPIVLTAKELSSPPPRIIRMCCSFGTDLRMVAVPVKKITDITSIDRVGPHKYLGSSEEENGIIYTKRGGFIDLGHLRDQADWTAYLYSMILEKKYDPEIIQALGREGGVKTLSINVTRDLDSLDIMMVAGKIAYDLSVWHEIATWFGASTVPLLPERYSSFSVEDAYSNLLGVTIGIKALQSELPYEEAMTQIISQTLDSLGAVKTEEETYEAMEAVRNIWWTRDHRLPSGKVLLERQLNVYTSVLPMIVPDWANEIQTPVKLEVPSFTAHNQPLTDYYTLEFKLNYKFPVKKMFPEEINRFITQEDFDHLLAQVAFELESKYQDTEKITKENHTKRKDRRPSL